METSETNQLAMKTYLNIPVEIHHDPATGYTYCADNKFDSSVYASSVESAKKKLRPQIEHEIADALVQANNYQRRVIGCASGEVLIVSFRYGSWCYDIAGVGRIYCASCSGFVSFEEACDKARDHAAQVWGAVIWEC